MTECIDELREIALLGIEALADWAEKLAAKMLRDPNPLTDQIRLELLCHADAFRRAHIHGDMILAVVTALRLGALDKEIEMMDGPWLTGVKVRLGGLKGAKRRQPAKYDELRRAYEEVCPRYTTHRAAYKAVAKMRGVSERKVRRAVTGH